MRAPTSTEVSAHVQDREPRTTGSTRSSSDAHSAPATVGQAAKPTGLPPTLGMAACDASGRLTFLSPALRELLGQSFGSEARGHAGSARAPVSRGRPHQPAAGARPARACAPGRGGHRCGDLPSLGGRGLDLPAMQRRAGRCRGRVGQRCRRLRRGRDGRVRRPPEPAADAEPPDQHPEPRAADSTDQAGRSCGDAPRHAQPAPGERGPLPGEGVPGSRRAERARRPGVLHGRPRHPGPADGGHRRPGRLLAGRSVARA